MQVRFACSCVSATFAYRALLCAASWWRGGSALWSRLLAGAVTWWAPSVECGVRLCMQASLYVRLTSQHISPSCGAPTHICRSMRVTTSDNGITNAIEIYRTPHGQVSRAGGGSTCWGRLQGSTGAAHPQVGLCGLAVHCWWASTLQAPMLFPPFMLFLPFMPSLPFTRILHVAR